MSQGTAPEESVRPASSRALLRASGLIATVTLLTKITGFLRVATIAGRLGATPGTDAFLTAFLIPESLYVFLTEGAVTAAFVPPFTRALAGARGLFGCLLLWSALAVGLIASAAAAIVWGFSDTIVSLIAPGFDTTTAKLTAGLTRVVAWYIPLAAVAAVLFGGLHARGHFLSPALGPLLFNVAVITSAFFAFPGNVSPLAWGVLAGGLLQLLVQLPATLVGLPRALARPPEAVPGLAEMGRLLLPLSFSLGVTQIQILAERIIASHLPRGVITSLNLVQKLVNLPLGLVGIAVATPLVPALARFHLLDDRVGFAVALRRGLVILMGLIAPFTAICLVEPAGVVRLLFQRGAYGPAEVADAARMLWLYALSLPAVSGSFLLSGALLATGDALTPALVRAALLTGNIVLNFAWLPWLGSGTIPLCFSLMYLANVATLLVWMGFRQRLFKTAEVACRLVAPVGVALVAGYAASCALGGSTTAHATPLEALLGILSVGTASGLSALGTTWAVTPRNGLNSAHENEDQRPIRP
ncbi:MAG: murein biosynthesis integral membrane protein MurJ [Candidatus Riflebacteria bacterium]|nr:murein biosynthesis integral membrane protein MurJ [Candidatus Riflebacteria bacterium]